MGKVILGIAVILLLVTLSGMFGLTAKLARSNELVLVCAVLLLVARGLLRRGRDTRP